MRFTRNLIKLDKNLNLLLSTRIMTPAASKTIGTHSGTFHCDEILAFALLQKHPEFKDHKIVRSRDLEVLKQCDIVVDVGAMFDATTKRFDHHQSTFNESFSSLRPDVSDSTIKLSSAGLIYVHYGEVILKEILKNYFNVELTEKQLKTVFEKIYTGFIQEIDAIDNGVPQFDGEPYYHITTNLSSRVKNFNTDWIENKTTQEIDELFNEAKKLVEAEFLDKVKYFALSWLPARKIVEEVVKKRFDVHESGEIIELTQFCPWQEHLRDIESEWENEKLSKIKFVIYDGGKGADYRVQAVPVAKGSFVCRKFLNKAWRGLRDDELDKISGIDDCIFVHSTGFIGGNKTRKGALEMALKSLNAED